MTQIPLSPHCELGQGRPGVRMVTGIVYSAIHSCSIYHLLLLNVLCKRAYTCINVQLF